MAPPRKHGITKPHPESEWADRITLMQFRRGPANPTWEARYRLADGTWTNPRTLKTADWTQAAFRSVARYQKEITQGAASPDRDARPAKTFAMAADTAIDQLKELKDRAVRAGGTRKGHNYDQHVARLQRVLLPAFGALPASEITKPVVTDFLKSVRVSVRGEPSVRQVPAQSTIGNLSHTFRLVMMQAAASGWIDEDAIPKMSRKGFAKPEPAASFTRDEMKIIRSHMTDDWVNEGHTELYREHRYLLRACVALVACSGIRPGLEMDRLRLGQVVFDTSSNDRSYIHIEIRKGQGKHHLDRSVIVYESDVFDASQVLKNLIARKRGNGRQSSDFLFTRFSDDEIPIFSVTFRALLKDCGLTCDPITGMDRSLYSLRHYFATEALLRNIDIHLLALQMGTSAKMIQTYYSKVTTRMMAPRLSGNDDRMARVRAALEREPPEPFSPLAGDDDELYADEQRRLDDENEKAS